MDVLNLSGKNFVFIHITKTGGTSLADSLGFSSNRTHFTFKEAINGRMGKSIDHFKQHIKFSVIRNPLARLVSVYHYCKERHPNDYIFKKYSSNSFDYWANSLIENYWEGDTEYYNKYDSITRNGPAHTSCSSSPGKNGDFWLCPQYQWLMDKKEKLLVDDILILEDIESQSRHFAKKHKIKIRKNRKLNSSRHDHWQKYYTEKTADFLIKLYKKDFELYGLKISKSTRIFI